MSEPSSGQTADVADKNAAFFAANDAYAERVAELETYRQIRQALDRELDGVRELLDIGNGGVFDYDTSRVGSIVAVDLFPEAGALPENVRFIEGDALDLPVADGAFDGVAMVMLFHHLTGSTSDVLVANVRKALAEAERALAPGGRLIVVESCVAPWFYRLEQRLYAPLAALSRTRLMKHPPTLQLPAPLLQELMAERFTLETTERIPTGRLILQFGHRWPAALSPARPWLLTARR